MRKFSDSSNICGKFICDERNKQGLSQEQLANKLQLIGINVDRSYISRIETQQTVIKDFELLAFCLILKIDFQKLIKLMEDTEL